ncbi:hypothetical protein MYX07_04625, partial [Patescibacteria group bacterium AH-259-L07]|nr:hypothetical protein [Patescibacteria group bacterium AH-259-L07]
MQYCKSKIKWLEAKPEIFFLFFLRLPPAPLPFFLRIRKFLVLRGAKDERRRAPYGAQMERGL